MKIEIPDHVFEALLNDAAYGACRYWTSETYTPDDVTWVFVEQLEDEQREHIVGMSRMRKGAQRFFEDSPYHAGLLLAGKADRDTADVFAQYCCFGEVKYA